MVIGELGWMKMDLIRAPKHSVAYATIDMLINTILRTPLCTDFINFAPVINVKCGNARTYFRCTLVVGAYKTHF